MEVLGIDVGGSGIKGAIVNVKTGKLTTERERIATPQPATPKAVAQTVNKLVKHFDWKGQIGCGFPAIIRHGVCWSAGNIDKSWIGTKVEELFEKKTGLPFSVINDADAAGLAEMQFGAGIDQKGLVVVVTIGTGLGSGVFLNGELIPNFELGQLFYKNGKVIERYAADSARKREDLSYKVWGKRFNQFLEHVEFICSPDLFILGGGASKKLKQFEKEIKVKVPFVVAQNRNQAGIIGAALAVKRIK